MSVRVYVGNIPFTTTEYDLRDFFTTCGEVLRVDMVVDRDTGRSRGFAFVDLDDHAAREALALNGSQFGGRRLVINHAKERQGKPRATPPSFDR
jgi:RNA recognition motif-containing protein